MYHSNFAIIAVWLVNKSDKAPVLVGVGGWEGGQPVNRKKEVN